MSVSRKNLHSVLAFFSTPSFRIIVNLCVIFLSVIIADMKVRKNLRRQTAWPANQIRFDDDGQGYTHDSQITSELGDVRRRYVHSSHS